MSGLTIQEHIDEIGWIGTTTIMFVSCGLYWLCDAIELGLVAYLVPVLKVEWSLHPSISDSIASIVFGGIVFGAFTFGYLSDRFGRKKIFLLTAIGTGAFGLASAWSPALEWMLVLRFCCGIFLGGGPTAYSTYLEFIPTKNIAVMSFFNLWFTFGIIFEAVMALFVLPTMGWRWLVAFSSAPIIILCFIFPFLKESPQWLHTVGRKLETQLLLDKMYESAGRIREAELIDAPIETNKGNLLHLCGPELRRRVFVFIPIWFSLNLVYYGYVFFNTSFFLMVIPSSCNTTDIGNYTGIPTTEEDVPCFPVEGLIILIIVSAGEAFGAFITALLINRNLPRKWICFVLLLCSSGFLFCMFATESVYIRAIFSLIARACIFGVFCAVYLWTPLVIPAHLRASTMGIMGSFGKIASICAPFISSLFDKNSILIPVVVYGSVSAIAAILSLLVGVEPETEINKKSDKQTYDDETALLSSHLTK